MTNASFAHTEQCFHTGNSRWVTFMYTYKIHIKKLLKDKSALNI